MEEQDDKRRRRTKLMVERWCRRQLARHDFVDTEMTSLFHRYIFGLNVMSLQSAMSLYIIATVAMTALDVAFMSYITVVDVSLIALAIVMLIPLVFQHTRYMKVCALPIPCLHAFLCSYFHLFVIMQARSKQCTIGPATVLWDHAHYLCKNKS